MVIEGDNLEVLKILQKHYYGKIKMIYIDPPYNTGNDFVYHDNYADPIGSYLEMTGQRDGEGKLSTNTESDGRFHSNWLNMMYPRLKLARDLLTEDGVIFISIDDNEVDNLRKIGCELFGEQNYVATFPWRKRTAKSDVPFGISQDYEWILVFARSASFLASTAGKERKYFETDDFPGKPWRIHDLTTQRTAAERPNSFFTLVDPKTGKEYPANPQATWRITQDTFQDYYDSGKIVFPNDYDFLNISRPVMRYFKSDDMAKSGTNFGRIAVSTKLPDSVGMSQTGTKEISQLFSDKVFSFPKPSSLIKFLVSTCTGNDDLILDFFAGSGTTAHAVMALNAEDGGNRKCISVQLPEPTPENSPARLAGFNTIAEITRERIRRAGKKILEEESEKLSTRETPLDTGFRAYKLTDTNFTRWRADSSQSEAELMLAIEDAVDSAQDHASHDALLTEVLIKLGLSLTEEVTRTEIEGLEVYSVDDGLLLAYLDEAVKPTLKQLRALVACKPSRLVILEDAFASDDQLKTNLSQECRAYDVELWTV